MDVVLVAQYEAIYWQNAIHTDEVSAGYAVPRAFGAKIAHRSVVSLAADEGEQLV
jgi:hypothetical protein